jgi:hypothetical protein
MQGKEISARAAFLAALGFCFCALGFAASAAPGPQASAVPDFSGYFVRIGDLWFDPVDDDKGGKPIGPLPLDGPDAENIYAGDSSNPILQPWARDIVRGNAESEIHLQHVYTADDSCWPSGVPQAVNLLDEVQFLQTKDRVTILYRRDHQVRRIWLNRPHSAHPKPSWYGESVGHYEGDTLVIDTIALKAHKMSVVDPFGTPHTDKIHVVERYRPYPTPFGKRLEVIVRVDDPGAFTMAWKGMAEYQQDRSVTEFEEMACAENNRDFADGKTFGTIPVEMHPAF